MEQKRYWLRGLVVGVVFGLILVFMHENVREIANVFGIKYDVYPPLLLGLFGGSVQVLYNIGLLPFFFLGILIMFFQFYLPPITYGVLGTLIGWAYGKFNKKIVTYVVFFIIILILFIPVWLYLLRTASRSQWDRQNYTSTTDNSTQIKRVQQ